METCFQEITTPRNPGTLEAWQARQMRMCYVSGFVELLDLSLMSLEVFLLLLVLLVIRASTLTS